ncbi:MAG: protein-L-isoaspartate(D-aspartate) O-methyltransferase [Bacteroidia bacterium]|nr:protein-L-isoaspartate(D-aspartate) O-methyltransferase [Bacteroidia bacterium]
MAVFLYNCEVDKFTDTYKDKGARRLLIRELQNKGIVDSKVLEAMGKVQRHLFIHNDFRHLAYEDKAFPIGEGQTISQPFTVAYQTQLLHVEPNDKILEIGTGSGYQAAVLLEMGATLFSIERQEKLYLKTKNLFAKLSYKANLKLGDGSNGWESEAPFDKIIVTAGAPKVPQSLVKQLKIGGILIIPVGDEENQIMHTIIKKTDGSVEVIPLKSFRFVPLIGKQAW